MEYRNEKSCKHIEGIRCSVSNCYYHQHDTDCTASEVAVGPHCADCSGDTACATFKPKAEG